MRSFASAVAFVAVLLLPVRGAAADLPRHGLLGTALVDEAGAVRVRAVVPGSAAAAAGVQAGDVVRSLGGKAPATSADVVQLVRTTAAGTTLPLVLVRDGAERTVRVTLKAPADEDDPAVRTVYGTVTVQGSLRRTLLDVPKNASGRRPALLLIGGIGCFSVDVAANPEDGYLRIARDVARAGFVTMRLEKSGVGDSQGPPCQSVDFNDESASYAVALDALRRDPRVDPRRVYLLGHSIGTLIAPRLALQSPVAGVVAADGVGRDWFEYELINLRRQLVIGGDPPAVVDAKLAVKERCMHRLLVARESEDRIERDEPDCKAQNGIYPVEAPYVQEVAALNVIEPWTRMTAPSLVLYGTSDYVVDPDDHARMAAVANAAHPGTATLRAVPAMDHLLHVAATPAEFYANGQKGIATPYQTGFSDAVVGWLCAREACVTAKPR